MNLIRCPFCFMNGNNERVCEVLDDGSVRIIKFDGGYHSNDLDSIKKYTIIRGDNFVIYCGKCGNEVYSTSTRPPQMPYAFNVVEMMGTILLT